MSKLMLGANACVLFIITLSFAKKQYEVYKRILLHRRVNPAYNSPVPIYINMWTEPRKVLRMSRSRTERNDRARVWTPTAGSGVQCSNINPPRVLKTLRWDVDSRLFIVVINISECYSCNVKQFFFFHIAISNRRLPSICGKTKKIGYKVVNGNQV